MHIIWDCVVQIIFDIQFFLLRRFTVVNVLAYLQGVLLYGPPGTGKTLLARAVAHHTECTFIRVSGSELVQKFIGEGSRMVRELFVMARWVFSTEKCSIHLYRELYYVKNNN